MKADRSNPHIQSFLRSLRTLRLPCGIIPIMTQIERSSKAWQGPPLTLAATWQHYTAWFSSWTNAHRHFSTCASLFSVVGPSLLWGPKELEDPALKPGSLYSAESAWGPFLFVRPVFIPSPSHPRRSCPIRLNQHESWTSVAYHTSEGIYSLCKYWLSTYYVPGSTLAAGNKRVNRAIALRNLYSRGRLGNYHTT